MRCGRVIYHTENQIVRPGRILLDDVASAADEELLRAAGCAYAYVSTHAPPRTRMHAHKRARAHASVDFFGAGGLKRYSHVDRGAEGAAGLWLHADANQTKVI